MTKKAWIVWGGWDGHEPEQVANIFGHWLRDAGVDVAIFDNLDCMADAEALAEQDLFVPVVTMSTIEKTYVENLSEAVADGTGFAGCHGGMCDAFRDNVLWAFSTGGTWVSHPGGDGVSYPVHVANSTSPLTEGVPDFEVTSEQYYLHVDPAVGVLATTPFPTSRWYHSANGHVDMPVVWTKRWGVGRVYYNALGHHADTFDIPEAAELMRRGLLWALEGKTAAKAAGLSKATYAGDAKNF